MVQPQHVGAAERERVAQRVADDRRPQVPHVHLFCDVRRRKVNNDALGEARHDRGGAVDQHGLHVLCEPRAVQLDVDEARPCEPARPRVSVSGYPPTPVPKKAAVSGAHEVDSIIAMLATSSCATTASATARGALGTPSPPFFFSSAKMAIALLHW